VQEPIRNAVKGIMAFITHFGYRSVSRSTKGRVVSVYENCLYFLLSDETFHDCLWASTKYA